MLSHRYAIFSQFSVRLFTSVFILTQTAAAWGDRWTDITGSATIEARFCGMWDDKVILEKGDGTRMVVPLDKLNSESRIQAEEMNAELKSTRPKRWDAIKQEAVLADTTKPLEVKAPFKPFPNNGSLQEYIDHLGEQVSSGHPEILWDAIPPSWQKDINQLVCDAAAKIPAAQWQPMVITMDKLGRLLKDQKTFILNHPLIAAAGASSPVPIGKAYDANVGLFRELFDPQFWGVENLKTIEISEAMKVKGPAIGGFLLRLDTLARESGQLGMTASLNAYHGEQDNDNSATLIYDGPQGRTETKFIRFENRWVPKDLHDHWQDRLAELRKGIDGWGTGLDSPFAKVPLITAAIGGFIDPLLNARTQAEFNQQAAIVASAVGAQIGSMMPKPANPQPGSPGNAPGSAASGYGSSSSEALNSGGSDAPMSSSGSGEVSVGGAGASAVP